MLLIVNILSSLLWWKRHDLFPVNLGWVLDTLEHVDDANTLRSQLHPEFFCCEVFLETVVAKAFMLKVALHVLLQEVGIPANVVEGMIVDVLQC